MEYTIEHIDKAIENLGRLTPAKLNKKSTRKCPLKDTVFMMAPRLLDMQDRGFTADELVAALSDEGISTTKPTLSRYLREHRKALGVAPTDKPKRTAKRKSESNNCDTDMPNKEQPAKKLEAADEQDELPELPYLDDEGDEPDDLKKTSDFPHGG